jgi:hypothetical protein
MRPDNGKAPITGSASGSGVAMDGTGEAAIERHGWLRT